MNRKWYEHKAVIGILMLLVVVLLVGFSVFWFSDPRELVGRPLSSPSMDHWFGTNGQGQDVFRRTLAGGALTLSVALMVATLTVLLGTWIGVLAAMAKGFWAQFLETFINMTLVIPGLPLTIVIAAYAPPGPMTMVLVLSLTGWAWTARVMKAQAMSLRDRDFVLGSRLAGDSIFTIVRVDMLPNLLPIMAASFIGACNYALGAQVGLEFLGLGDLSMVTWGTNLYWAQNDGALFTGAWWTYVPSGLGLAIIGFILTWLNRTLDEIANPSLGDRRFWLKRLMGKTTLESGVTPVMKDSNHASS